MYNDLSHRHICLPNWYEGEKVTFADNIKFFTVYQVGFYVLAIFPLEFRLETVQ